jgi:hypothetical protein
MEQINNIQPALTVKKVWNTGPEIILISANAVETGNRTNHHEASIANTSVTPNGHHWTFTNGFKSGGYFFGKADYQS